MERPLFIPKRDPEVWDPEIYKSLAIVYLRDARLTYLRIAFHEFKRFYKTEELWREAFEVAIELINDGFWSIDDATIPGHYKS